MAVQPDILDTYDDRRLVAAFQAGEEDAFARIVGVHHSSLIAEAKRRLRSAGDAEDAVQETLLRAYLALDRFGGEYHLRAWLGRILANACVDMQSKRAAEGRLRDRLASRRELTPAADEVLVDPEVRRVVKDAVDALPESYRYAFVRREVEKKSYSQLAEEMNVTEENARARVHRARGALQRTLRSVGGALGVVAIRVRLVVLRRRGSGDRSSRVSRLQFSPHTARDAVSTLNLGPGVQTMHAGSALSESVPQGAISDVSSVTQAVLSSTSVAPVSQVSQMSQLLGQAVATPLSQAIMAIAPEAAKASMPFAGTIATLAAAGAAMVGSGAAVMSQAAASKPTPVVAATSPKSLASYSQGTTSPPASTTPPVDPSSSDAAAASTTTSSTIAAASQTAASRSGSVTPPGGADAWSWVNGAASNSPFAQAGTNSPSNPGAASSSTSSSTSLASSDGASTAGTTGSGASTSGSSFSSTTTAPSQATGSASTSSSSHPTQVVPVTDCPWTTSFPGGAPGVVPPAPPEASTEQAVAYFVAPVNLSAPSSVFQWQGPGTFSDQGGTSTLEAVVGVCLSDTNDPLLVANLTQSGVSGASTLQLKAGLVDTTSSGGVSNALFRGTASWLSGPNAGSAPVSFVADVITPQQGGLMVAFFGQIPGLVGS